MMSFKLAFKNMKKNMKDYVIYFLTLVLGVAIFYVFNSMESQQAMLDVSTSKRQIYQLMTQVLGGISVFISFVLGFLIVYANNFLIKRRKKEFGLYMLLGMGKRQISKILLLETFLVGIFSLGIGLVLGIFASQFMSILVAKLFEINMTEFQFIFSMDSMTKTMLYFAVIYVFVMFVNLIGTSRYKLIDLLTAAKKNEKVKMKNPVFSVILFIVSVVILGYAYHLAMVKIFDTGFTGILTAIALGIIGTFLFFYSLAGFLLKLVQNSKKTYLRNLNMFVLRQINSKVNTTVFSMSVICILLFLTICIFSSAMSLNYSMTKQLKEYTPVDISITKTVQPLQNASQEENEERKRSIQETLSMIGFDLSNLSEYVEVSQYTSKSITLKDTLGNVRQEVNEQFPMMVVDSQEMIMKLSDYNRLAKLYGKEELQLNKNEYIIICNYDQVKTFRDKSLAQGTVLTLEGKQYHPKYEQCIEGLITISSSNTEFGTLILPDEVVKEDWKGMTLLSGNYQGTTEEEKMQIEAKLEDLSKDNAVVFGNLMAMTKIFIYDASAGLSATATFIGLYLGIVFLISSAAILALKELSDSSDNKERYQILRRIGADDKMIYHALLKQIGIFFAMPLALAIIHSIFGIKVASIILSAFGKQDLVGSIMITAIFVIFIYGSYFIATYLGSKNIIKENMKK